MERNIKILRVMESTYGNGSYWIEYEENGIISYELTNEVSPTMSDDELKELIVPSVFKVRLSTCSDFLKELIKECLESDNEMWYVDEEDFYYICQGDNDLGERILMDLYNEVSNLGLIDYVDINFDKDFEADTITVYGGILTKILFDEVDFNSTKQVVCLNCGKEFKISTVYKDGLGHHAICSNCESSFDIDLE